MRMTEVQRTKLGDKHSRLDPAYYLQRGNIRTLVKDAGHAPLGDLLAELHDGSRLPTSKRGIFMLRLSNLRACEVDFHGLRCVDPEGASSWASVQPGDVVFTRSATPFRAAVVGNELPSPLTISSEITILRHHSAVLPEYLAAVLSTPAYAELLKDLAYRRHPSALKRLRLKDVRTLPIPLPSRSVQAEIKEAYEYLPAGFVSYGKATPSPRRA